MNIDDMQAQTNEINDKLGNVEGELKKWLELLVENCMEDPENAKTYLANTLKANSEYISQSAHLMACFEEIIIPMKNAKKLRKMGDLTQVVLPVLILCKMQQLMNDKLND